MKSTVKEVSGGSHNAAAASAEIVIKKDIAGPGRSDNIILFLVAAKVGRVPSSLCTHSRREERRHQWSKQ